MYVDDRGVRVIVVRDVQRIICIGDIVIGGVDGFRCVVVCVVERGCGIGCFGEIVFGLVDRAVVCARRGIVRFAPIFPEVVAIDGREAFFRAFIGLGGGSGVVDQ